MIDIFYLYSICNSEVNSYQGGFIRPKDFERQVNDISIDLWISRTEQADKTTDIEGELSPFRKSKNIIVQPNPNGFGIMAYPTDYGRFSSARILVANGETFEDENVDTCDCNGQPVTKNDRLETDFEKQQRLEKYRDSITEYPILKIPNGKWGAALQHRTKKPTLEKPAITPYDNGFRVAPRNVSVLVLDYYSLPEPAVFAYTITPGNTITGQGDVMVYDKENSKPLQWDESMIPKFMEKLLAKYGIFTRDPLLIQASQIKS